MGMDLNDLHSWRILFRAVNASIFDVINNAIMVAAKDYPLDLKLRRDQIVHLLYNHCCPYNPLKLPMPQAAKDGFRSNAELDGHDDRDERVDHEHLIKSVEQDNSCAVDHQDQIESLIPTNSTAFDHSGGLKNGDLPEFLNDKTAKAFYYVGDGPNKNQMGDYKKAEALMDLVLEGDEIVEEVSRIKEILDNCQNQSDSCLLELLMKLQRMDMNMQILKATMIGKAVSVLGKHDTKEIRKIARSLIRRWRGTVDKYVGNAVVAHDEFPPRPSNEGAPAAPSSSSELLMMFKGVDQTEFFNILPRDHIDGTYDFSEELDCTEEKQLLLKENPARDGLTEKVMGEDLAENLYNRLPSLWTENDQGNKQTPINKNELVKLDVSKRARKKDLVTRQPNLSPSLKTRNVTRVRQVIPMEHKVEAARRKLREGYQKAKDAKKQRAIKIVDANNNHVPQSRA